MKQTKKWFIDDRSIDPIKHQNIHHRSSASSYHDDDRITILMDREYHAKPCHAIAAHEDAVRYKEGEVTHRIAWNRVRADSRAGAME